jgi:hypothetical protein
MARKAILAAKDAAPADSRERLVMNPNDAKITSLYVSEPGVVADIEDDAPNSNAPPGSNFRVTLEMVAGLAVSGTAYHLKTTCSDLTDTTSAGPQAPAPASHLNPVGAVPFGAPPWIPDGSRYVFNQSVTVPPPVPAKRGHVYRYTASLFTTNGDIVSIKESDPFVLL